MSQESAMYASLQSLREQIAESKQREAKLQEIVSAVRAAHENLRENDDRIVAALQQDLDAARNDLEIARDALSYCCNKDFDPRRVRIVSRQALVKLLDPTAALAERDRAIREECAAWLSRLPLPRLASDYRREFNLDPKPEGV